MAAGLTQKEVAERIGLDYSTITKFEQAKKSQN
jgi:transcriptional regulator with XRE-family HTH domain